MSARHAVPVALLNIRSSLALLCSCDFAGESMTYIDHYSMYIDRLSLLLFLALALLSIAVSTLDLVRVSESSPRKNIVRKL